MPPPSDPPVEVAPLFALERQRLLLLLSDVSEAGWQRPTPCPQWTVLGLACHLVGDDFGMLARHRDGYLGTPSPQGLTEPEFIAWLDDLQLEWVRAARRLSPRLVVDLLAWTGPQCVETLRAEDPRLRTARVSWAGLDPVPVWLDQLRELSEYWIHRQQLLEALDRPGDVDPVVLRPILLAMRWAYAYRLGQRALATDGDTVRIDVTQPVGETWFLVSDGDGWDFRTEPGPRAVATLTMTGHQAWRLLSNNLSHDARADVDVTGDPDVVEILWNTRAIIGTPE